MTTDNLTPLVAPVLLPVPDLPAFEQAAALTVRQACAAGHVIGDRGQRINPLHVKRWCQDGRAIVSGGPRYRFPAVKLRGGWTTCPAWCAAWARFERRLRAAEVRRQMGRWVQQEAAGVG